MEFKGTQSLTTSSETLATISRWLTNSKEKKIKGMAHSVYFLSLRASTLLTKCKRNPQTSDDEVVSIGASLFNYLLHQGYKKAQILVVTVDQSQASSFQYAVLEKYGMEIQPKVFHQVNGYKNGASLITLLLIGTQYDEGYEDEKNDMQVVYEIFFNLANQNCTGLFIIGDESRMIKSEETANVLKLFQQYKLFGSTLDLKCTSHGTIHQIRLANEFPLNGGCYEINMERLECGHTCYDVCHPCPPERRKLQCKFCPDKIAQNSSDDFDRILDVILECNNLEVKIGEIVCKVPQIKMDPSDQTICKHGVLKGININSNAAVNEKNELCQRFVTKKLTCGHSKLFHCYETIEGARCMKRVVVTRKLECGHSIQEESKCYRKNRISQKKVGPKCEMKCGRKLSCGHSCENQCDELNTQTNNLNHDTHHPCTQTCQRRCNKGHVCEQHLCQQGSCPPCKVMMTIIRPECQHDIEFYCHLEEEILKRINLPCENERCKKVCKRNHPCQFRHRCSQNCPPCEVEVTYTLDACNHEISVPCYDFDANYAKYCGLPCTKSRREASTHPCPFPCHDHHRFPGRECPPCQDMCEAIVDLKDFSSCGHSILVKCHQKDDIIKQGNANLYCTLPCNFYFDPDIGGCGHLCEGKCSSCASNRFHESCRKTCGKLQICGHKCMELCSSTCSPCEQDCEVSCDHGICDKMCALPCEPCLKPCTYSCPHGKCKKSCNEICDKAPCMEFCPIILKNCGHPCSGYCGEPCPPLCAICDEKELLLQDVLGKTCITPEDRFILLVDCGHTIDAETLTFLMNIETVDGEMVAKKCPILSCRKIIRNCNRFKSVVVEMLENIELVKKAIYGYPKEILALKNEAMKYVLINSDFSKINMFSGLKTKILEELMVETDFGFCYGNFLEMPLVKAKCLAFVAKTYERSVAFLQKSREKLPNKLYLDLEHSVRNLIGMVEYRPWPITNFELRCIAFEWQRIEAVGKLYYRRGTKRFKCLAKEPKVKIAYENALRIPTSLGLYDENKMKRLNLALKELNETLEPKMEGTDAEEKSIMD